MNRTVVIAGGGPTGLMLACELGLAGVRTVVLESADGQIRESAGMAINSASVELLGQRGLMDELRKDAMVFPKAHFAILWLDATELNGRHEHSVAVDQWRVEDLLRRHATELGVDLRYGHHVVSVDQNAVGVTVGVRTPTGSREISCAYLVGCDGQDSAVRQLAGIGFPGRDPTFYGIVGDVAMDFNDLADGQLGAFCYPDGGIYTGIPFEQGVLRVVTAEFNTQPPCDDDPVTLDELVTHVERITGTTLKATGVRWLTRYRNPTRNAERYRADRVFLAGDAAHMFYPLGGLRLNACLHDAANLGWKLAGTIHGWAPPGLLDTYHDERFPVGKRYCRAVAAQVGLMQRSEGVPELRDIFAELLRFKDVNSYLLDLVAGLDVRYLTDDHAWADGPAIHPLIGRRVPNVSIMTADGKTTAAATLRSGRGVVLDLSGGVADLSCVAGWADRVNVVAAEPPDAIEATALLIRPDGHVAWADTRATDAEGLRVALTTWFGSPADRSDTGMS